MKQPTTISAAGATSSGRVAEIVDAALDAACDVARDPVERTEMLMEIAMGLQLRPKTADHLEAAVALYGQAIEICPADRPLLAARLAARRATALQAMPGEDVTMLERARDAYQMAIPVLTRLGQPQEVAEAEMNLGLVLQHLAGSGRARLTDAIASYQRSLRTFDAKRYPVEFVLLQNNLATAFLSMPIADGRAGLREALAVQCFEEGLKIVNLVDQPVEYAMLQNNLGNALQYASSRHAVENNRRALAAYDEALRVRSRATMPVEYANTLANKANCLWNLPDDGNLIEARALYEEARDIFLVHGEAGKAAALAEALAELDRECAATDRGQRSVLS